MLKQNQSSSKEGLVKPNKELFSLIEPNSIVGTPIVTPDGSTIIPVLKVLIGTLGGGGEYGEIKLFTKQAEHPFAGGNGTLLNMSPCGFLVINLGDVKFIKVNDDLYDKLFDKTAEILSNSIK